MQPCWTDDGGSVQYLVRIVFHADTYDVTPLWPTDRDEAARMIRAHEFVKNGTGLTRDEFEARAQLILDWSNAQEPPCRHYFTVDINDVGDFEFYIRAQNFMC